MTTSLLGMPLYLRGLAVKSRNAFSWRSEDELPEDKRPLVGEIRAVTYRSTAAGSPITAFSQGIQVPRPRFSRFPDGGHKHYLEYSHQENCYRSTVEKMMKWGLEHEKLLYLFQRQRSSSAQYSIHETTQMATKLSIHEEQEQLTTVKLTVKYGVCKNLLAFTTSYGVWLARKPDSSTMDVYAVKRSRKLSTRHDETHRKRTISEYCLSRPLNHTNVVRTLDLAVDDNGGFCLVMEYCPGGTLFGLIKTAGRLEVEEANCLFKQLLRGVQYIHSKGIAHRNLKPENIYLTSGGTLKLSDFSCAECFRSAGDEKVHLSSQRRGTLPYIAPEEFVLETFDPRPVDVWSTGIIYWAMRTSTWPWRVALLEDPRYEAYVTARTQDACSQLEFVEVSSLQSIFAPFYYQKPLMT